MGDQCTPFGDKWLVAACGSVAVRRHTGLGAGVNRRIVIAARLVVPAAGARALRPGAGPGDGAAVVHLVGHTATPQVARE